MPNLGINFDEISDNLDISIQVMRDHSVRYGELRTVNGQNFVFWNDDQVSEFKKTISKNGINLVAAATPLFKWYDEYSDPTIEHDNFGFNPRMAYEEKKKTINRVFEIAEYLSIPKLRIFSGLGSLKKSEIPYSSDDLLEYTLDLAELNDIDLCLENEPVCKVHNKNQITSLFKRCQDQRLKLWLDIANLYEIGEEIDSHFLSDVSAKITYLHVKDYIETDGKLNYVPVGEGQLDYEAILRKVLKSLDNDVVVTIETHSKKNKIKNSISSITETRKILEKISETEGAING